MPNKNVGARKKVIKKATSRSGSLKKPASLPKKAIHKVRQAKVVQRFMKGFTLIEVMIVLAIAGLILLVVLIAAPAAQRATRNHNREVDINYVAAVLREYTNNHNGNAPIPTRVKNGSSPNEVVQCTAANIPIDCPFMGNAHLAYYRTQDVNYYYLTLPLGGFLSPMTDPDRIAIGNYFECTDDETLIRGSTKKTSMVVMYAFETSGGYVSKCLQI